MYIRFTTVLLFFEAREYSGFLVFLKFIDVIGGLFKILMFEDYERVVQSDSLSIMVCGLFDYLKTKFNDGVYSSERELTIVSDTIFMSYNASSKDNVILALSDIYVIQRMLLVFGFISEGIATMGNVIHQGGILYGLGYAKVKEMMQTLEYPVVLIDAEIFGYVENAPTEGDLENVLEIQKALKYAHT